MAWWNRWKRGGSGQVVDQDGRPVTAKADGTFADLEELSRYVTAAGIRIVDPGVPLGNWSGDTAAALVWETQPSVRKVVDYIARALATIPWNVYERVSDTERRRVTDHPLARLLGAPGPMRGPSRLWHSVIVDWLVYDRWCMQLLPSADTESGWELRRKPARRFHVLADDDDQPQVLYLISSRGPALRVPVTPGMGYVFDHGYATVGADGTSPMRTLQQILDEQREAVRWRRQVWRRGARVPTVIERPADAPEWSNTARDRFVQEFSRFVALGAEAGGTPLLEDGMTLKVVQAFSPREATDIEGRQLSDAEVASAFHIPPELIGAREGTFSNIDAFRQMLYTHSIGPDITMLQDVVNTQLVPQVAGTGSRLYAEMNVAAKLRGSFTEQASVLQTSVGAPYMTRAEARAIQNLPYLDGTEQLVTPLNVLVGGLASPTDTAPKASKPIPKAPGRSA
jgi:HK97 family phage portal protein